MTSKEELKAVMCLRAEQDPFQVEKFDCPMI